MRRLSRREKVLAFAAGVVLIMAAASALGAMQARARALRNLRGQTDRLRSNATALGVGQADGKRHTPAVKKEDLLELITETGRRLDSIQVSESEYGLSAVFTGGPETIWDFCRAISAADHLTINDLSLRSSGGRLRGTLNLVVPR